MQLKKSSAPTIGLTEQTRDEDAELPVGSRENLLALVTKVFESDSDPRCAMLTRIPPAALVAEEDGRAAFQLRSAIIRFPLKNYINLGRGPARGATRAQLIDACEAAKRWQPGEWRIVGATHSESFKNRWTRKPSGVTKENRDAMFASPPKQADDPNMQLTKPVQVRDPVIIIHLALAEVSRQRPRQGQKNQKASAWDTFVAEKGKLEHMPFQGRKTRQEAIRIICDQYDIDESDIVAELSAEIVKRVQVLRGYGLTDEEVAGALGVQESQVAQVEVSDAESA